MTRKQVVLTAVPLMVLASISGVLIFEQGLSLAGTILVGYAVVAGLTVIGIVALVVSTRGRPHSRPPVITRSH
jgi:hypothetical protein